MLAAGSLPDTVAASMQSVTAAAFYSESSIWARVDYDIGRLRLILGLYSCMERQMSQNVVNYAVLSM